MRNKTPAIVGLFFLLLPAVLSAQTAAELNTVLETSAVTCAQAARFVLTSADVVPEESFAGDAAFEQAVANRWLPSAAAADDPVRLGDLSFLLMRAFQVRGGLMYTLRPGPRYAFRTMVSRSLIQGTSDPAMTVSGERFLRILGNVLSYKGEDL
jgi:hypothetical protein